MAKDATTILGELFAILDPDAELAAATNDVARAYYAQWDRIACKWHHYLEV